MKNKKIKPLLVSCIILDIFLLGFVLFQVSKSRTFQFFGGLTNRVNTDKKVVALTFDDAPTPYTDEVLKTLKDKDVLATFYVIGNSLEQNPDTGKRIVQTGHELGNHSFSHQRFLLKSMVFIENEVEKTNSLIRQTGYTGEITFRPPNGKKLFGLPYYLRRHNIKTIMWDVEPDTYGDNTKGDSNTDFLVKYTLGYTKPGSIILLHPFCESCESGRKAIPKIIDRLKQNGYSFVTISQLLSYD